MDPATAMLLMEAIKAVAEYAAAARRSNLEALEHLKLVMDVFEALPDHATRIDPETGKPE